MNMPFSETRRNPDIIPASIKGLCFDLFNTLVSVGQVPETVGPYTADILGVDRDEWNQACFSAAHPITQTTNGFDCVKKLAHSINPEIPLALIEEASAARDKRFEYALLNVESSVLSGLHILREAGFRLALISNASTAEVQAWSRSPLATLFDSVIFSCESGCCKPDKQIYGQALSELKLQAEACLFIGDGGSHEHRGAAAVGMKPVFLKGFTQSEKVSLIRNTYKDVLAAEVTDITDLIEWLGIA